MLAVIRGRSIAVLGRLYAVVRREDGQALVEYALILSLIAVVAMGVLQTLGGNVVTWLQTVANDL